MTIRSTTEAPVRTQRPTSTEGASTTSAATPSTTTTTRPGHSAPAGEVTDPRRAADARTVEGARLRATGDTSAAQLASRVGGAPASAEERGVSVSYGKDGAASFIRDRPVRGPEAERVRARETEMIDIRSGTPEEAAAARRRLLEAAPQINATSVRAGNSGSICGAAAMTNALIMSDRGGNNAAALEGLATRAGVTIRDEERTALDNFRAGTLSPRDVEHLQQLTYRSGVRLETGSEPGERLTAEQLDLGMRESHYTPSRAERAAIDTLRRDPSALTAAQQTTLRNLAFETGVITSPDANLDPNPPHLLTSGGMGALSGAIRAEGGLTGTDVTFHNSRLRDPRGHDFNHWTVDVGGSHFNSLAATRGGGTQITDAAPAEIAESATDGNFEGRVRVGDRHMTIDTPAGAGRMGRIDFHPSDDSRASWGTAYGDLAAVTSGGTTSTPRTTFTPDTARAD